MRIFVGNLPHNFTEEDLQIWFGNQGYAAENAQIVRDHVTGHSRGFAFVNVVTDAKVEAVVEKLNRSRLGGRVLTVGEATVKSSKIIR